jgi:predicted transcriptional regulator
MSAKTSTLSRRERQIMDVLYRLGHGAASEIRDRLPGEPSDSTVRTQLRVLEEKGHVRHEEQGVRYVYFPTVSPKVARRAALRHLVDTFFEGSTAKIVTTLLDSDAARLSDAELDRIEALIAAARKDSR